MLAMGARTRRFTGLARVSGKATAVVVCAVMLLAGCGGSAGSASDSSTPVIRGDVATSAPTVAVPGAPAAPTGAAGDGKVTVTVAAGSSGGTPTSYIVTAVSTTKTCTVTGATGGSCDVAGLTNGTPYTFTAIATNEGGASGVSVASSAVTPVAAATTATVRTVTFVSLCCGVWRSYRQSASTPTALMPNAFVNPGSSFLGWNTKNDGRGVWYADGEVFPFSSDTELISIWGKPGQPYKIIAKLEGPATGSVSFLAAPNPDGTPAASMNYVLGVGRSGGRTFAERTVSVPGTYLFDLPPDPTYYFYVQFAGTPWPSTPASLEVPAVVSFNANGGTGTMANQTSSKQALLTANAFTRPGYVFDGWSLSPTGGLRFGDGTGYEFLASITVYARWAPAAQSTVTFNANGGTGTMANQSTNVATALTANAFTRSGYVFDGWATTSNGSNAYANGASFPFTANATLYARWAAVPSTVTTQTATVPGAPGLTSLSRRSKTEVWVTFSAPSSTGGVPITGYTVTATRNGVDVTQSFPAQAGTVSVGPLTRYAVYTFTVRALNSFGTSAPSNAKNFRVDR